MDRVSFMGFVSDCFGTDCTSSMGADLTTLECNAMANYYY